MSRRVLRRVRVQVRRGFTLVELMIAIVLMSIVLIAIFAFFNSMSNIFYAQEQVVDTQSDMRFAMDFITRDVRRAGYLGTPSAMVDSLVCPKPQAGFFAAGSEPSNSVVPVAIRVINKDNASGVVPYNVGTASNGNIRPDTMMLIGSMEGSDVFPLSGVTSTVATLDGSRLRALFGVVSDSDAQKAFEQLFIQGRMIRVSKPDGQAQLGVISADPTWDTVAPTVPIGGIVSRSGGLGCGIGGLVGEGYEISVLNVIRYQMETNANDATRSDLVRTELDARTGDPLVISGQAQKISVLNYAVDFQAWVDGAGGGGVVPQVAVDQVGDDEGNLSWLTLSSNGAGWQRARVAHMTLSGRTPREDASFPHVQRTAAASGSATVYGPLTSFNLDESSEGAAHVVTMSASIELPNLTVRNLR